MSKVSIVRNSQSPQIVPIIPPETSKSDTAIPSSRTNKGGRPPIPTCNLPPGYRHLRYGKSKYTDELADSFIDAYYENAGSLTRTCRELGVQYAAALLWRQEIPHFAQALKEVDEIIKDEVHSQFMERVLTTYENNPAWKLTFFKKHFPEYIGLKGPTKVVFNLTDSLIKRADVVEGEVIKPKSLEKENANRPTQPVETPSHTGEVS